MAGSIKFWKNKKEKKGKAKVHVILCQSSVWRRQQVIEQDVRNQGNKSEDCAWGREQAQISNREEKQLFLKESWKGNVQKQTLSPILTQC